MVLPDLADLQTCLDAAVWRRLLSMARTHRLAASARWRKADLIAALYHDLTTLATLQQAVADLQPGARSALLALLRADGALPAAAFTAAHGPLPLPYSRRPAQPALMTSSPAEQLWYLGLIYLAPPVAAPGVAQRIIIPVELWQPLYDLLLSSSGPDAGLPLQHPGLPPDPIWHLAILLATIAQEPVRPRGARWLPPHTLGTLAGRFGLPHATPAPLGERARPYLAFLHYLAEVAGFIAAGNHLFLAPPGRQWLGGGTAARWQTLWQTWQQAAPELAEAYHFPWAPIAPAGHAFLSEQARRWPAGRFLPLADVLADLRLADARQVLGQPGPRLDATLAALLAGPWFWLGLLDLAVQQPQDPLHEVLAPIDADRLRTALADLQAGLDHEPADPEPIADTGKLALGPAPQAIAPGSGAGAPSLAFSVRLTPLGAWLLGLPGYQPPAWAEPAPWRPAAQAVDQFLVPPAANPQHLARLAPWCAWLPPELPATEQRLRLTAEHVGRAAAQSVTAAEILAALAAALQRPPTRRLSDLVRQWAEAGQQVRLRRLTVLETATPALMGRLRSRRLARRRLGDALSPTRAAVDPGSLPELIQAVRRLGLFPALDPGLLTETAQADSISPTSGAEDANAENPPAEAVPASPRITPGQAVAAPDSGLSSLTYLAALVYAGLAEHVDLPAPVSYALLDDLARGLTLAQREAAQHMARQTLEALAAALRGYLDRPHFPTAARQAVVLRTIETALVGPQDLVLVYWDAGRAEPITRRVTPYWIERRQDVPYLVAYCHLRNAERTFRVDRIVECRPAATGSSPGASGKAGG